MRFVFTMILLFFTMIATAQVVDSANAGKYEEALLVANAKAGSVSVIDIKSLDTRCEINVAPDLEKRRSEWSIAHRWINWYGEYKFVDDLAISPDGKTLYVSRGSLADVAAFDLADGKMVWRVPVEGYRSDHMALSSDGKRLFVSVVTGSRVIVIDTAIRKIVGTIPTWSRPHGIKVSPDGKLVLIGQMKGNAITIVYSQDFTVKDTLAFDEGVRPFEITRDGKTLYVQLSNFHGFLEYDIGNKRLLKKVFLPETDRSRAYKGNYPKDAAHHGITLSNDESTLCVVGTASNYVALLSRPALNQEVIIPVGEQPSWAINSLDGKYCYISSRGDNTVSVVSYAAKKEVKRIRVGEYPQRMLTAKVRRSLCRH